MEIIESHGDIPHVASRGKEAEAERRNPAKKARRWTVEACHSGFNRFGKLQTRMSTGRFRCWVAVSYAYA